MKKTLGSLSLAFVVIALTVHLPGSVAELRGAARASAALQAPSRIPLPVPPRRSAAPSVTAHLEEILGKSGGRPRQRELARSVLGLLDSACQEKLETLNILYGRPKHRGLAGRGVILVSGVVPDEEFIGLLLHEGLGHFRDITCLTGEPEAGASEFRDGTDAIWNDDPSVLFYRLSWWNERERKTEAQPEDFVTGYAYEADNFEDLAESVAYYMTQEQSFRERARTNLVLSQKLLWLESYLPKERNVADGMAWNGDIPWDATKLAFRWND